MIENGELEGQVDDVLATEPVFGEEGTDVGGLDDVAEWLRLCLQVAALEADDAVGQGIGYGVALYAALLANDVLADNLYQVG